MKVPSWVYIGAALAAITTAGAGMATSKLSGPEHLSHNDATQIRGAQEIPANRTRSQLAPGLDAEASRAVVPAETREADAAAKAVVRFGFKK